MRRTSKKPEQYIKIAEERIEILFGLAEKNLKVHPERSRRYVQLARKIGLRYNVRLPKEMKRKFCRKCSILLVPSVTSKVRIDSKTKSITIKCLNCEKTYRYPYKR